MKSVSFSFLPAVYTLHSEGNHSLGFRASRYAVAVYTLHSEGNHSRICITPSIKGICRVAYALSLTLNSQRIKKQLLILNIY